jgi:hypothetical protein
MSSYSEYSPYYNTSNDRQGRLGIWVPRPISGSSRDQYITISEAYNQRPDLMAYDLYGDSRLWWVFAQRNPNALASDPLGNFLSGTQIYIPDANELKTSLGV